MLWNGARCLCDQLKLWKLVTSESAENIQNIASYTVREFCADSCVWRWQSSCYQSTLLGLTVN